MQLARARVYVEDVKIKVLASIARSESIRDAGNLSDGVAILFEMRPHQAAHRLTIVDDESDVET
jgi:hypothetical protein